MERRAMPAARRIIFTHRVARPFILTPIPTRAANPQNPWAGPSSGAPAVIASRSKLMLTIFLGLALGLAIGAGCRWFDIPSPSPPRITGALLVLAMTLGYLTTDLVLSKSPKSLQFQPQPKQTHE